MSRRISAVSGLEILDSRGYPTVRVYVELEDGTRASASVPAGASTGRHEAVESRDGTNGSEGAQRYGGRGVLRAAAAVGGEISGALLHMDATQQSDIDNKLIETDGTPNKSRLGANAILGASMAVARVAAQSSGLPLYAYLGGPSACRLPVPMMNVINGGAHAENSLDFQEFMIVPHGAPNFEEAMRYGSETFHALTSLLRSHGYATGVGDEGGFAPNLKSNEEACALIMEAIAKAGFKPGIDIAIALDPAASSFSRNGQYDLSKSGQGTKSSGELNALYGSWIDQYPIVSIEDGFDEEDWAGFRDQTASVGDRIQIVGDDLYVTNTRFIERGIEERATNAVLIKLNQVGTVTETISAIDVTRAAGWNFIVSHRSGETEDTFIADFAVAMGGGQIKTGSLCRGERIAKYNRLLEISHELGRTARFESPFKKAEDN
ncbi:MAG: phosphopyruvate hydratase [Acetobacteraceae bacterium]|nr:phosphopyruvate hydratase [Acetobacteraceae bacterium]